MKNRGLLDATRFAMIHAYQANKIDNAVSGNLAHFLLYHAITYNYHDDAWWMNTSNPADRTAVAMALLEGGNEVVAMRVLNFLLKDRSVLPILQNQTTALSTRLLGMAFKARTPTASAKFLGGLKRIVPMRHAWDDSFVAPEQGALLGKMALLDTELARHAIKVIGHLHVRSAVDFIVRNARRDQLPSVLLDIQKAAGNLPSTVSADVRARTLFEWIYQQLTLQPARLVGGYALAMLGSTFGIATQIYLTYRLPDYLDSARISSSLIQGLIVGIVFGLGIFLSRLLVERFEGISPIIRFGLASIFGMLGMSAALLLFNGLFLNTAPSGLLMPAGCLVIASSYAVSGFIPSKIAKAFISTLLIFAGILGTWWVHQTFSGSLLELTPLFRYDYAWPLSQIAFTAFLAALWMGVLGNFPSLKVREE
jgi:hypothetical protein